MNRGEEVFGANWIEQWRQGLEENAFGKCAGMTPFVCAETYGVDVFCWSESPEGDDVWSNRDDYIGHNEEW